MENLSMLTTIIGVVLGIGGIVFFLFPKLKEKNVEVKPLLDKADMVLDGATTVINIADKLLPGNVAINILKIVEKYATIGVHQAEQLYVTSQLDKDKRNVQAKDTIYAALKILNVEVTPDIEKIVTGTIEAECLAIGHKDKSEAEKLAEKEQLKTQLQEKNQENEQLKNKIATIQNTVA